MTQLRAYIETTIPSFYFEVRTEPEMISRKNWTRHWWDFKSRAFELVTSEAVLDELRYGEYPTKSDALSLVDDLTLLPIDEAVIGVAEMYINRSVMPKNPAGDALHLALASYYECDFLVTWNCKHLANANKFQQIRRLNEQQDLYVPSLVTPLELVEEEDA